MNKEILDTIKIITGDKPISYYLAGFFFAMLAIILSIYMHSRTRDKLSTNTPYAFSWTFLIWDNAKRIVAGLILMFIFFRIFDLSNVLAMVGLGFTVAFGLDKLIEWLMQKADFMKFLQADRENFKGK